MNRKTLSDNEFVELIDSYCNESIEQQSFEELQEALKSDPKSRQFYLRYLNVIQGASALGSSNKALLINHIPSGFNRWSFAIPTALVFSVLALAGAIFWLNDSAEDAPTTDVANVNRTEQHADVVYVGKVVSISSDVVWAKASSVGDFLCRVSEDDRIEISTGLVQVDYFGGASVIIRAPSAFVITGPQAGALEYGELTGIVSKGDFSLQTPSAKVLDLGTEFGVVVDHQNNTDVCVFDGKVELSTADHPDAPSSTLLLSEGMAARVDGQGITPIDSTLEARFTRTMSDPKSSSAQVSLLDVFAAHIPGTQSLGQAVSPNTGLAVEESLLRSRGLVQPTSDDTYSQALWHPMLDGIFIPNPRGKDVQINSSGSRVQLPINEGRTSAPVWTRRKTGTPRFIFNQHFWGGETRKSVHRRLENSEQGLMGIHANVGVTFDLLEIEKRYARKPTAFRTLVANLDNKEDWDSDRTDKSTADVRVFVDGELVASQLNLRKSDGDKEITLAIPSTGQFLTIVSTDCGNISYDQVVLIDPVIEFE